MRALIIAAILFVPVPAHALEIGARLPIDTARYLWSGTTAASKTGPLISRMARSVILK